MLGLVPVFQLRVLTRVKRAFDVYFSGEILDGHETDQVKSGIGKLFKISGPKLDALFSGVPVRVKKNISTEKAGRFRKAFLELGALVQIVPAGQEPPASLHEGSSPSRRPAAESTSLASEGGLTLAPIEPLKGESIPEAPAIDTSYLEVAPPGTGEPLQQRTVGPGAPDPGNLSLAPMENQGKENEEEREAPLPDISHLEALPPQSGSLEEFATEKEAVPLPDISKLSLDDPKKS